jgi:hypothetical protein
MTMGLFRSSGRQAARQAWLHEIETSDQLWKADKRPGREKRRNPTAAQQQQQDRVDTAFARFRRTR